MGLATSALISGQTALLSYQGALQAVGQNVANAGNADYTRQTADLSALPGSAIGPGLQPGAGVALTGLKRQVDEALETRLRTSLGDEGSAQALRDSLARIEVLFDETSGVGVSAKLVSFFNSMSDVQNSPDDLATRSVAISAGQELAGALQQVRADLLDLGTEFNGEIRDLVAVADQTAAEIADLNQRIVEVEAGGNGQASALRDRRDALLRELSVYFDVVVREQPDGSINIYVGSEPLVQHGTSRGLTTTDDIEDGQVRTTVRFADTNSRINARGGQIAGLVAARDEQTLGRLEELDQFAAALIAEVNAVHADGQGLTPLTEVTAENAVLDATAALNSTDAGLRLPPVQGSFFITVTDEATGTPLAHRVAVDLDGQGTDTSLNDVVADINANVSGVTAAVSADGRLSLTAAEGFSFSFGHDGAQFREDSARLLSALGINTFFAGADAADIAVRSDLVADSGLLAAARENRVGDGLNAGQMALLVDSASADLGSASLRDFYNGLITGVATAGSAASNAAEAAETVAGALRSQRESVSGVSIDEEAIDMLKFERAFQGAARYVSVVDSMLQELMNLVR